MPIVRFVVELVAAAIPVVVAQHPLAWVVMVFVVSVLFVHQGLMEHWQVEPLVPVREKLSWTHMEKYVNKEELHWRQAFVAAVSVAEFRPLTEEAQ